MLLRTAAAIAITSLWASALPAQCIRVDALCTSGAGVVEISWNNPGGDFQGAEILRDGNPIVNSPVNLPNLSTTDTPGAGTFTYTVIALCSTGSDPTPDTCVVNLMALPKHIILDRDPGGNINSASSLSTAITGVCAESITITDISELIGTDFSANNVLWSLAGTFPDNTPLDVATGEFLTNHVLDGGPVYHEGPDTWGFDPPTAFDSVDGVDGATALDGDDSFISMDGSAFAGADLSGFPSVGYTQDQVGNDLTDRIGPTGLDSAGSSAGVIWTAEGLAYDTGIFYDTDPPNGKVISVSWEFGGFGGNQVALVIAYFEALGASDPFRRGDVNDDAATNIADSIILLNILFMGGAITCGDSADVNDDGSLDIADVIFGLGFLFSGGPAPPAPFPGCGADPTSDLLSCDQYNSCP